MSLTLHAQRTVSCGPRRPAGAEHGSQDDGGVGVGVVQGGDSQWHTTREPPSLVGTTVARKPVPHEHSPDVSSKVEWSEAQAHVARLSVPIAARYNADPHSCNPDGGRWSTLSPSDVTVVDSPRVFHARTVVKYCTPSSRLRPVTCREVSRPTSRDETTSPASGDVPTDTS